MPPQDVITEREAQNNPNKVDTPHVEAQSHRPDLYRQPDLCLYAKWKVGGFLFPFIFLFVSHNL